MRTVDFDYELPDDLVAQHPIEPRDAARLLIDGGPGAPPRHANIADLPKELGAGDVVVVNSTRVLPARLRMRRASGGAVEVLVLHPIGPDGSWAALVRPSRKLRIGEIVAPDPEAVAGSAATELAVEIGEPIGDGQRAVRLLTDGSVLDALAAHGEMPLPPYIHERIDDPERYQTMFADRPSSAAAPTAGLHFTPAVRDAILASGARLVTVDLTVGLATFRPMSTELVADHPMHHESYVIDPAVWSQIQRADRVVAVGTTTVRAIESAGATGELAGSTDLFIRRPYEWRVTDVLMTNFHLPKSSLLVLVDAFVGDRWRDLYAEAIREQYRMLSFGDAMLLRRTAPEGQIRPTAPEGDDVVGEDPA